MTETGMTCQDGDTSGMESMHSQHGRVKKMHNTAVIYFTFWRIWRFYFLSDRITSDNHCSLFYKSLCSRYLTYSIPMQIVLLFTVLNLLLLELFLLINSFKFQVRRTIGSPMHVKKAADALIFTNGKNLGGIKRGEKFDELSDENLDGAMRDTVFEMRQNDEIYEYEDTLDQEEPRHTPTTHTRDHADLSFPGPEADEGHSNTTSDQATSSSSASAANSLGQMSASAQATLNTSSSSGQSTSSASATTVLSRQGQQVVTPYRPLVARSVNAGMSESEALATAVAASLVTSGPQVAGGRLELENSQADQDEPGQCHLCGGDYYYQVTINFSTFKIFLLMYRVTDYDIIIDIHKILSFHTKTNSNIFRGSKIFCYILIKSTMWPRGASQCHYIASTEV